MSTAEQGRTFERRVGRLVSLLGYKVDYDALVSGRQIDPVIQDDSDVLPRHYLVECKNQAAPVNSQQYDSFHATLDAARRELIANLGGEWLADPESNQLTLLGDYGPGRRRCCAISRCRSHGGPRPR